MSEPELLVTKAGDSQHALVVELCELYRGITAAACPSEAEAPEHNSFAMTAACMFAGTLFGHMLYTGVARPQDKRRVTESMMRNFRAGIDAGLRQATRVEREMGGSGQA